MFRYWRHWRYWKATWKLYRHRLRVYKTMFERFQDLGVANQWKVEALIFDLARQETEELMDEAGLTRLGNKDEA